MLIIEWGWIPDIHIKNISYDIKQFIYNHLWRDEEKFKDKLLIKKVEYKMYNENTEDIDFVLKYLHRLIVKRY